jgi:hypothetical protein
MDPPDFLKEFKESIRESSEMLRILGQDCNDHFAAIQINHSQTNKRSYVRSVFALIEGVQYNTRAAASSLGYY